MADLGEALEKLPHGPESRLAIFEFFLLEDSVDRILQKAQQILAVPSKATGAKRKSEKFYVLVALMYRASQSNGMARGIIPELADVLTPINNGARPSNDRVKGWVQGATKRDLLGPGERGRAARAEGSRLREEFDRLWPESADEEEEETPRVKDTSTDAALDGCS